jgi:hypothetical protein
VPLSAYKHDNWFVHCRKKKTCYHDWKKLTLA